jgi:hypothetical protein
MSNDKLEALLEGQYRLADILTRTAEGTKSRDHTTALALVVDKIVTVERLLRAQYCDNCGVRKTDER